MCERECAERVCEKRGECMRRVGSCAEGVYVSTTRCVQREYVRGEQQGVWKGFVCEENNRVCAKEGVCRGVVCKENQRVCKGGCMWVESGQREPTPCCDQNQVPCK